VAHPNIDAEFVYRMEDVLVTYARAYDAAEPLVCLDDTSLQLIVETRYRPGPAPRNAMTISANRTETSMCS
jgi:hypothetical protein